MTPISKLREVIQRYLEKVVQGLYHHFHGQRGWLKPTYTTTGCNLIQLVEAVTTNQEDIVDTRKEDTWKDKDMLLYFVVVMMIFFCAADMGKYEK